MAVKETTIVCFPHLLSSILLNIVTLTMLFCCCCFVLFSFFLSYFLFFFFFFLGGGGGGGHGIITQSDFQRWDLLLWGGGLIELLQ